MVTYCEINVYNEKKCLRSGRRGQIGFKQYKNDVFNFWNKMAIDFKCKSLFFINIILLFNFLNCITAHEVVYTILEVKFGLVWLQEKI